MQTKPMKVQINNNTKKKKEKQSRDFGIISHATDDYNHTNQRLMCLTLFHPFLHESPTIFTPFLSKTLRLVKKMMILARSLLHLML